MDNAEIYARMEEIINGIDANSVRTKLAVIYAGDDTAIERILSLSDRAIQVAYFYLMCLGTKSYLDSVNPSLRNACSHAHKAVARLVLDSLD